MASSRTTKPTPSAPEVDAAGGVPAGLLKKALFVTIVAVAAYCVVVAVADFQAIRDSLRKLPGSRVALALALASASFGLRFVRWQGYLRALDIQVAASDSALIFTSGLGMSATPGKAGELLKSLMLRQVAGTPVARSVPIVAAERITDAMALVLLGSFGLIDSAFGPLLVALSLAGCATLALVLGSRGLGQRAIALASRVAFVRKHGQRLITAHEALLRLCAPAPLCLALCLALVAWAVHGLCLLCIANVFDGVSLTTGEAMVANAAPLLAGALAMLPGGLGLTEASLAGALIGFGRGSVTPAVATAITLVVRILTLWWAVGLGLAALGLWQLRRMPSRPSGAES
jgi:glycosyltransferase 2 family protein